MPSSLTAVYLTILCSWSTASFNQLWRGGLKRGGVRSSAPLAISSSCLLKKKTKVIILLTWRRWTHFINESTAERLKYSISQTRQKCWEEEKTKVAAALGWEELHNCTRKREESFGVWKICLLTCLHASRIVKKEKAEVLTRPFLSGTLLSKNGNVALFKEPVPLMVLLHHFPLSYSETARVIHHWLITGAKQTFLGGSVKSATIK